MVVPALRLSSCGIQAQLLHGMWKLPEPGIEPISPALAGGFQSTVPLDKSGRVSNNGCSTAMRRYLENIIDESASIKTGK